MSDANAKADIMKKKTEVCRRTFNLPDTESVIQDYACSLDKLYPGRLYISQNYLCFASTLSSHIQSIPFRKVTDVQQDSTLFFNNAITIVHQGGTNSFGALTHRDETFHLIHHLWKHPPSFIDLDDFVMGTASNSASADPNSTSSTSSPSNSTGGVPTSASGESTGTSKSGSGSGGYSSEGNNNNNNQGGQLHKVKVDTTSTKNALRLANEAREIGGSTLNELAYQAEVIDRVEYNVENIHANLDKADRLVRGIESLGGSIANGMSNGKSKEAGLRYIDRTITVEKEDIPADIDILWKLPNDALQPSLLRFMNEKFMCVNITTKQVEKDQIFSYDQIDQIVIRARPFHLDIRFHGKTPRFRLMSSYIQSVVNEFVLKSKSIPPGPLGYLRVIFEPGIKKFSYGSSAIALPTSSNSNTTRKAAFFRQGAQPQNSAFINKMDVDQETKQQLFEQEKDLDQISGLLGDLHAIGVTMGTEIERQSEQLDRVTTRVDYANDRMEKSNKRVGDLL